jgi:hypothetical protein
MNRGFRIDFHFSQVSSPANPVNLVWKLCTKQDDGFPRLGFQVQCAKSGPEFGHEGNCQKLIMGQ